MKLSTQWEMVVHAFRRCLEIQMNNLDALEIQTDFLDSKID